jgi:acyl carrier protein
MSVFRRQVSSSDNGEDRASERHERDAPIAAVLEFSAFSSALSERLRLDLFISRETSLTEDLDLDSLQMLELVVLMDELGAEVFEEILPQLQTVGDLYEHYRTRTTAERRTRM